MAIVNFTSPLINQALQYINSGPTSTYPFTRNTRFGHTSLRIYSSVRSAKNFPSNLTYSGRLINWFWTGWYNLNENPHEPTDPYNPGILLNGQTNNTFQFGDTPWIEANATGTAQSFVLYTFFWNYGSSNSYSAETSTNTAYVQMRKAISGTVGGPGSGADLIINDPNVVVGNQYKIIQLNLDFPLTYNY